MKKLLSILGAMTLIGTASTSVIACGGGEKPKPEPSPTPKQKIDISTKISNSIALGQLSANTKADFLAKLQTALVRITDLNTITTSDYDVYKAQTTTAIQDGDIIRGTSLNIKIVAKGNKFKGNKDNIVVNYSKKDTRTNLSTLAATENVTIKSDSTNKVDDFKSVFISKLKLQSGFSNLKLSDVDITKFDGTNLKNSDIIEGILATKVKAKSTSTNFTGEKTINVTIAINYTDEEIVNAINSVKDYQINKHFEKNIIISLKKDISKDFIKNKISNNSIKNSFIESKFTLIKITKSDGITELQDSDFNFGTIINDCKIIYKYGTKNDQSVNLKIIIPNPNINDIIYELENTKYEIEANAGPNAFADLDNNIQKNNFEFFSNSIKNKEIKKAFEISNFKLNNILTNDLSRGLENSDFVSGQILDAIMIVFYYEKQLQLNLSIIVK